MSGMDECFVEMEKLDRQMEEIMEHRRVCKSKMDSYQIKFKRLVNESKALISNDAIQLTRYKEFNLEDAKVFYDTGLLKMLKIDIEKLKVYNSEREEDQQIK